MTRLLCLLLLAALAASSAPAQEEPATVPIPRTAKPLALGAEVTGALSARTAEAWYAVDLTKPGDAQSLAVDATLLPGSRGDADLMLLDPDGGQLASSTGTGDRERCLLPLAEREKVYVRLFLFGDPDEWRSQRHSVRFTLRAELSPREAVPGLPVFIDDLLLLRDGDRVEGSLPVEGDPDPSRRLYRVDLAGIDATAVRVDLTIPNPDESDIDLRVLDADGADVGSSTGTGSSERVRVPAQGDRLFVAAFLPDGDRPGSYTLALRLSHEEPGPAVLERVAKASPKRVSAGGRVLGQTTGERNEFFVWFTEEQESRIVTLVLNPADPEAQVKLTARSEEGWILDETDTGPGLRQVPVDASSASVFLVQVTADRPCGFALCGDVPAPPVAFDPASATPLNPRSSARGVLGGPAGNTAVFAAQAPVSALLQEVSLAADSPYADLDLFVCAAPNVVLAQSATPGGMESADFPAPGCRPLYVVVTAAEGVSASFTLTLR